MPGKAASTGETWVLGSAPNRVAAPENSFAFETIWAWTSSPMTVSQLPLRPSIIGRTRRRGFKPLAQFDPEPVRVADFGAGISGPDDRTPDDADAALFEIGRGRAHIADFERQHAIAEMLALGFRRHRDALIRDQLDGGAAEVEIGKVERAATRPVDMVARPHPEAEHFGVKPLALGRPVGDDLDMVDALEHSLASLLSRVRPESSAVSSAAPIRNTLASSKARPITCNPSGKPSADKPAGTAIAGNPARLTGTVKTSFRYMAIGSSDCSSIANAAEGATGARIASTRSKAWAKSRATRARTRCAFR